MKHLPMRQTYLVRQHVKWWKKEGKYRLRQMEKFMVKTVAHEYNKHRDYAILSQSRVEVLYMYIMRARNYYSVLRISVPHTHVHTHSLLEHTHANTTHRHCNSL